MFKNVYTTRMSDDWKTLERRFKNIIAKTSVKTKVLAVICICLIAVLIASVVAVLSRTEFVAVYSMDYYAEFVKNNDLMPKTEKLGEYEDVEFRHYHNDMFWFESDSYTLIVKYGAEEYEKEKSETEIEHRGIAHFTLDGFDFKVIETDFYPKEVFFIGTSNSTCEIAYVYFYDIDLDYIDTSYAEFLIKECGWDRKEKFNENDSYKVTYNKNGVYEITFKKDTGDILYNRKFDYRHEVKEIEDRLFNVMFWVGTNAKSDVFIDTKNDRVSEEYFNLLCYDDENVVYCRENAVVIADMFDSKDVKTVIKRDFSETVHLSTAVTLAELKEDRLCIGYLTGEDFEEVYEEIEF